MTWTKETLVDFIQKSPVVGQVTKVHKDGTVWIEGGWWEAAKTPPATHAKQVGEESKGVANDLGANEFKQNINQNFTPWIKPDEGDVWELKHNNRLNWTTKNKWRYKDRTGYKLRDDQVLLELDEQGSGAYLVAVTKIMDLLWANDVEGVWKVEEKNGNFRGVKL